MNRLSIILQNDEKVVNNFVGLSPCDCLRIRTTCAMHRVLVSNQIKILQIIYTSSSFIVYLEAKIFVHIVFCGLVSF